MKKVNLFKRLKFPYAFSSGIFFGMLIVSWFVSYINGTIFIYPDKMSIIILICFLGIGIFWKFYKSQRDDEKKEILQFLAELNYDKSPKVIITK